MKYYKINLSSRDSIVIDEHDLAKFTENAGSGKLIKLKKGVVNPSFIVTILPCSQKEALEDEMPKIEGTLDEKRGVFRITKEIHPIGTELTDEF